MEHFNWRKPPTGLRRVTPTYVHPKAQDKRAPGPSFKELIIADKTTSTDRPYDYRIPLLLREVGPDVQKFMLPRGQYENYASAWQHAYRIRELLDRNPSLGQVKEAPKSFPPRCGIKDLFYRLYPNAYAFAHAKPEDRDYNDIDQFCQDVSNFLRPNLKLNRTPLNKVICFYCKQPNHVINSCEKLQNQMQQLSALDSSRNPNGQIYPHRI